jgi:hypothetical protein
MCAAYAHEQFLHRCKQVVRCTECRGERGGEKQLGKDNHFFPPRQREQRHNESRIKVAYII